MSDEPAPGSFEGASLAALRLWVGAQHVACITLPETLAGLLFDSGTEAADCCDASSWLLTSAQAAPHPYARLLAALSESATLDALN